MTVFADLEPCTYFDFQEEWSAPLLAVGWLGGDPYEKGSTPRALLHRLEALERADPLLTGFGGGYWCAPCLVERHPDPVGGLGWSQGNLFVPGNREIFVAPSGIIHYVADHGYRPPSRFVDAVLRCPIDEDGYLEAIRAANGGSTPSDGLLLDRKNQCDRWTVLELGERSSFACVRCPPRRSDEERYRNRSRIPVQGEVLLTRALLLPVLPTRASR